MTLQVSPFFFTLLIAAAITLTLALVGLRYRETAKGVTAAFAVLNFAIGFWTLVYAFELAVVDEKTKLILAKVRFIGVVFVPVWWMFFTALLTRQGGWIIGRKIAVFSVVPLITLLILFTNEVHHLMWSTVSVIELATFTANDLRPGTWFWVHSIYSYGLIVAGIVFLVRAFLRSPTTYRRLLIPLFVAVIAPWISNAITILGVSPLDFTPFAFTITGVALGWSTFRLHLLSVIPIARDSVMENIVDGVLVTNEQAQIVDLNPATEKILGIARQQSLGKLLQQILPAIQQAEAPQNRRPEIQIQSATGTKYLEVNQSPLLSRSGQTLGSVVILHDVTDEREHEQRIRAQNEALIRANEALTIARQQAEEATRLKSEFLATMSHELRTPLNAIIGFTEIQLEGMAGELNEEQRLYQQKVLNNASHLLRLITDILDLAKIEAGRVTLNRTTFAIGDWVEGLVSQISILAEQKGLTLEVERDPGLPAGLYEDPTRLKQVALNLLSNAVKFTDQGKVKLVIGRHDANTWKLAVSDTGIGVPEAMHEAIFQEFRQADSSPTREYGGTGLGLAIVKKLLGLMKGQISLQSKPGEGSTFTVLLPIHPIPDQTGNIVIPQSSAKASF